MRKLLGFLLLTLAITLPAWPQSTEQQNPIHTQTFDAALPRESFECSATQATLGTHMVNFLDTDGSINGYVDCHGNIHGASGGSCPGGTDGELQGNNAGACAGVPGSTIDFTSGQIALAALTADPVLLVSSQQGNDAIDAESLGNEDTATITASSYASANPGATGQALDVFSEAEDDTGAGAGSFGQIIGAFLYGANATGEEIALNIETEANWTGGAPVSSIGILVQPNGSPLGFPASFVGGISVADQNAGGQPAYSLNAAVLIQPQTAGPTVYGINDANGLFTFQGWNSPETDTLANLTTQATGLPSEGFQKLCSDCDTPLTEGAACTSAGDMAGALAIYIRGALLCF